MSIQEERFKAIADAIREKDGSTEPIPANDFAKRIYALPVGNTNVGEGETLSGTQEEKFFKIAEAIRTKEGSTEEIPANEFADRILALEPQSKPSRLPEGYTELQYIIHSYTSYINSGLRPTTTLKTFIDAEIVDIGTASSIQLTNSRYSATVSKVPYDFYYNSNYYASSENIKFELGRVKRYGSCSAYLPKSDSPRFLFGMNTAAKTASINGESVTNTNSDVTSSFHSSMPTITLLGGGSETTVMRVYSIQMYNNMNLIRDFVPCKNPNGEVGMYDLVGAKFYGNSGTRSFIEGPVA